jgi:hypothetical protein
MWWDHNTNKIVILHTIIQGDKRVKIHLGFAFKHLGTKIEETSKEVGWSVGEGEGVHCVCA